MHDLPELRLLVQEPGSKKSAVRPVRIEQLEAFLQGGAPAQYGPQVQSLAVYLSQFQLLPLERTCEALNDLCHCHLSEDTLVNWIAEAAKQLKNACLAS